MQCTNKSCGDHALADRYVKFEILTDLGLKCNSEFLCNSCAVNLLSWGLAYRKQNKFNLIEYMPIEVHQKLDDILPFE